MNALGEIHGKVGSNNGMRRKKFRFQKWEVHYTPEDGGRLNRLSFDGVNLLTKEPLHFKPPKGDYGMYETRPVYGYDDCFPAVMPCTFINSSWEVPDHGELCWIAWAVDEDINQLLFSTHSQLLPVQIQRKLIFSKDCLSWQFEVYNDGMETVPFQYIMHGLMPLDDITDLILPSFSGIVDDFNRPIPNLNTAQDLRKYLLHLPKGNADMLYIQRLEEPKIVVEFKSQLQLEMTFPKDDFSTLGIWWNNNGYPQEQNMQRNECAFEPISGSTCSLEKAYEEGSCLFVTPGERMQWQIDWKVLG